MALQGNLRDLSASQLLNLIKLARKTGTLTVEGPDGTAELFFEDGTLVFARSGNELEDLASLLHRAGKLTEEQARELEERPESTGQKQLGLLLISTGSLSQDDILQTVRDQVAGAASRMFTWTEGNFRFEADVLPPEDKITVAIDPEEIIREGSPRLSEWERLQGEAVQPTGESPPAPPPVEAAERPKSLIGRIFSRIRS